MKQICRLDKTNKRPYCLRKPCSYKADGTCSGPVVAIQDYYGLHNCPGDPAPRRNTQVRQICRVRILPCWTSPQISCTIRGMGRKPHIGGKTRRRTSPRHPPRRVAAVQDFPCLRVSILSAKPSPLGEGQGGPNRTRPFPWLILAHLRRTSKKYVRQENCRWRGPKGRGGSFCVEVNSYV